MKTGEQKLAVSPPTRQPRVYQRSGVLYGCRTVSLLEAGNRKHLNSLSQRIHRCLERHAQLHVVRVTMGRYSNKEHHGYTSAALLNESHVAIDSWPEIHSVYVNVAVCDVTTDGSRKKIVKAFRALKRFYGARKMQLTVEASLGLDQPRTKPKRRKRLKRR